MSLTKPQAALLLAAVRSGDDSLRLSPYSSGQHQAAQRLVADGYVSHRGYVLLGRGEEARARLLQERAAKEVVERGRSLEALQARMAEIERENRERGA